MHPKILRELRELLKKMNIAFSSNTPFIGVMLQGQRDRTLNIQPTEAMQLIRELQDSMNKVEFSEHWQLLRVLIAMCYCVLDDTHTARLWAKDATRMAEATNKEMNLAIAHWFLAMIYAEGGYFKDAIEHYRHSQDIFHKIHGNALNNAMGSKLKKQCNKRINQIEQRIARISRQRTRLLNTARNNQVSNIASENNTTAESNAAGIVFSAPVNVHVPIDNRSADRIDQNSMLYLRLHQEDLSNHEVMSATSIPIEVSAVNRVPEVLQSPERTNPNDSEKEVGIPINVSDLGYLMTPSLPIYGSAGAGPNGQVVLDEPDYNAAVEESAFVSLDGKEHEVHSLRSDRRIKISRRDFLTSIIPREKRDIGGKAYGWLKVIGHSMNEGKPIKIKDKRKKIEDGDYVLFMENNNMEANVGNIVLVSESLPDSGPIRLLVKQLVKTNAHFYLRSYSDDRNSDTGDEFADFAFDNCHQLIGEVIAVAKLRPSAET